MKALRRSASRRPEGLHTVAAPVAVEASAPRYPTACFAPSLQVVLLPNGDVGPCCRNPRAYGNIRDRLLSDIWWGRERSAVAAQLAIDDFSGGCEECGVEASMMSRDVGYVAQFDYWAAHLGAEVAPEWPVRIEFDLSNTCNLQCLQCHGELSSSIRIHREKRAPMPKVYGDAFFEDLRQFIPHLRSAGFAGGEPFLAQETFRVWDLCAELSPGLECTIVTNGTQWNRRVEAVLEQLQVQPVISMDGLTKGTYESIRIGSDHAKVMANIERFCEYARTVGTQVNINFCLMPQNVHELPDLLLFAEERDIHVNALTVLGPPECSLPQLPRSELAEVHRRLTDRATELGAALATNAKTWHGAIERIESWLSSSSDDFNSEWVNRAPMILQFPRQGAGPIDGLTERAALAAFADDGEVHVVTIGTDQMGRGWSPKLARRLGIPLDDLEGHPLGTVLKVVDHMDVVVDREDHYEAHFSVGSTELRVVILPIRDEHGWADEARAHYAFRDR